MSDEIIVENGLLNDNNNPKNKAAKTHGIRIFSINFPKNKVKANIMAMNKNRCIAYPVLTCYFVMRK